MFSRDKEHMVCVVCKQPVDKVFALFTPHGYVHPGPCFHYAEQMPISESSEELEATELLL